MTYEEAKAREKELIARAQEVVSFVPEPFKVFYLDRIKWAVEDAFTAGADWQRTEGLKDIKELIERQYRR